MLRDEQLPREGLRCISHLSGDKSTERREKGGVGMPGNCSTVHTGLLGQAPPAPLIESLPLLCAESSCNFHQGQRDVSLEINTEPYREVKLKQRDEKCGKQSGCSGQHPLTEALNYWGVRAGLSCAEETSKH